MSQLTLDLPHRESLEGADFLVASCNTAAVAMIDRWPDWPAHALALVGPAGAGKSHLAAVWRQRSGAAALAPEAAAARSRIMMRRSPAVLLDDADRCLAEGRLEAVDLFHLYNWLRERGGWLLLTARTAPARWPAELADLRSRLAALPVAEIAPPDQDLLAAVMVKQLADRQLKVDPRVVDYTIVRIERSFEAVERIVGALDAAALAAKRPITVSLAREVLKEAGEDDPWG